MPKASKKLPSGKAGKSKARAGEVEVLPAIDEKLVTEAVRTINDIVHKTYEKGAQGLLEIGQYVFAKFFGGDPAQVQFRGRQKENSFRALASHPELQLGTTNLHNAVALAIQEQKLLSAGPIPSGVTVSHRIALLTVKDEDKKKLSPVKARLLKEVEEKKLSVRQLQGRIAEASGKLLQASTTPDDGERTRIPRPLLGFLKLDMDRLANPERLAKLPKRQLAKYRKSLEDATERIKQLMKAIDAVGA